MARRKQQVPEAVAVVVAEFAEWRRRKHHGREPIPEALWAKGVALARKHTPSMVARRLGLTPRALIARMEAPPRSRPMRMARLVVAPPTAAVSQPTAALEIISPTGVRLRVAGSDVKDVVKAFVEACR